MTKVKALVDVMVQMEEESSTSTPVPSASRKYFLMGV